MQAMTLTEYINATSGSTPHVNALLLMFMKANKGFFGFHGNDDSYLNHPCIVNRGVNELGYHVMFDDQNTQNLWSQWQIAAASTLHIAELQMDQIHQIIEFKNVISQFENAGFFKKIWLTFKYRKLIRKEMEKE